MGAQRVGLSRRLAQMGADEEDGMVLQVGTDARAISHNLNPKCLQIGRRTDAGAHQQQR